MLPALLRFEWRYHTRRLTFCVTAVALMLISVLLIGTGYGPRNLAVNSPYVITQSLGVLSLVSVFVLTFFCAEAALRDTESGMLSIVFATPVGRARYLLSRFGGAYLAAATVLLLATLVLLVAPFGLAVEPARVGPWRPLAYAWAFGVVVLPNLLLVGAVLFAVAVLTRRTLATHLGAVAIYALYLVTALLVDSPLMAGAAPPTPEGLARAALLDPFGLSAFFEQTRYWSPAARNTQLLSLTGHLLLNRLLWLGVAGGMLVLTYFRCTFRLFQPTTTPPLRDSRRARPTQPYAPLASASSRGRAFWAALGPAIRLELRQVLRGWSFLALLGLWLFVAGMEMSAQLGGGEYGTRLLPTTSLLLEALYLPLQLLGTVVVAYYAAEVAWRERVVGLAPLLDATAASSAVFYLAKVVALAVLPLLLALAGVGVGLGIQLATGYYHLEPGLFLTLLWFGALPLVWFAVGALTVQLLSPNRWVGLLGGVALAFLARRGEVLGLEHPLLRFGAGPMAPHSAMDGFGPVGASFAAFMGYWAAVVAVLAVLSWGVWPRGVAGLGQRLRHLPWQWGAAGRRAALLTGGLALVVGGWLYWQLEQTAPWQSAAATVQQQVDYERAYRRLAAQPQPRIAAVRIALDLYPTARRAAVVGTCTLVNRSAEALDTVWIGLPEAVRPTRLALRQARLVRADARQQMYAFRLRQPLLPGRQVQFDFALTLNQSGLRGQNFAYNVTGNGSFLTSNDFLPFVGYRPGYELDDPTLRRRHGLPAASAQPGLPATPAALAAVRAAGPQPGWYPLDLVLSTAADQTALGPGQLLRHWQRGGRRYFHYQLAPAAPGRFAVASGRYARRQARQQGVQVELWYHPGHAAQAAQVLAAATHSLAELGRRYGRYPYQQLRLVEVPAWAPFGAFAQPGMAFFTENRGFTSVRRAEDVDLLTRRVAHEVSHQWWGGLLDPAPVAGASTLVETLAKHSEQVVLAAVHGEQALPAMLRFDEDRYLTGQGDEPGEELPLARATSQPYLYYGKGAVVMHGLRDLLGAERLDRALRQLLRQHGGPAGAATTPDLQQMLLAQAPDTVARRLVREWLSGRTVYDFRVASARARPAPAGAFQVSIQLAARKTERRGLADVPAPLGQETVEVALLDGPPPTGRVLHTARVRFIGGRAMLRVTTAQRPAYVVADPRICRLDRDRQNNLLPVALLAAPQPARQQKAAAP